MTLIQLLTAIANAIRGKTGSSSSIPAQNFPQEIAGITTGKLTNEEYEEADEDVDDILENTTVPTGTISITANGEYDVTNYTDANVNITSNYNTNINTTGITSVTNTNRISPFIRTINLQNLDFSNITSMPSLFRYCNNLESIIGIKDVNTSNVTSLQLCFDGCSSLNEIDLSNWNTKKVQTFLSFFNNCSSLQTVIFGENFSLENVSSSSGLNNMFAGCSSLSNTSLNYILGILPSATTFLGTKSLATIGLSSTQASTCTGLSNWSAAQAAGWTTGY